MNYDLWRNESLSGASRTALAAFYEAWHAGRPTTERHALFALVRAGMEPREVEQWLKAAQEGDAAWMKPRGSASSRFLHALHGTPAMLVPTLAAALALAAEPVVRADLDELERIVVHLHATSDPDRPALPIGDLAAELELDPPVLRRLLELTGLDSDDDALAVGIEPLYWTSFKAFLERQVKRAAPRLAAEVRLPIAATIEQVEWAGLGPYRAATALRLTPMTLLVGANGAGKTTALVALSFLRELAERGLAALDEVAQRFDEDAPDQTIAVTAALTRPGAPVTEAVHWGVRPGTGAGWVAREEILYRVRPAPEAADAELATFVLGVGRWRDEAGRLVEHTMRPNELALTTADSPAARWQLMALRQELRRWHVEVATLARWRQVPAPSPYDSLPSYVGHREQADELRRHVEAVTGFADFEPSMFGSGFGTLLPRSGRDPRLESAGVMRAIEILAWLFAPEPPSLLAIDELENHLHADLAARLIDVMRSVSNRTRIVLSTHSARVLRCFDPSEVRLVRRGRDGSSIVAVDEEPRLKELVAAGDLADLIQDGYLAGGA